MNMCKSCFGDILDKWQELNWLDTQTVSLSSMMTISSDGHSRRKFFWNFSSNHIILFFHCNNKVLKISCSVLQAFTKQYKRNSLYMLYYFLMNLEYKYWLINKWKILKPKRNTGSPNYFINKNLNNILSTDKSIFFSSENLLR